VSGVYKMTDMLDTLEKAIENREEVNTCCCNLTKEELIFYAIVGGFFWITVAFTYYIAAN
jgi:hypothetical protein